MSKSATDHNRGEFKQRMDFFSLQPDIVPVGGGFNNTVGRVHMEGKNGQNDS